MEGLVRMIEQGHLCRMLRTKTMFYQVAEDESKKPELRGPFWCGRTLTLYGPDGRIADADGCRPGRGCCETG